MSRLLHRDPFARSELHRETVPAQGMTCSNCGGTAKGGKLFIYRTERDGIRSNTRTHNGQFCSKNCHDSYHS